MSSAISFLRFPLTLFIVFYHCYCVLLPDGQPLYRALAYPVGLMAGETGVPAFFFISGFLFFHGSRTYVQKLRSRARSLLQPYLIWNGLLLLAYVLLMLAGHPQEIAGRSIADYGWVDYARAFIDRGSWADGNGQPMLCPYWYVRNLIVLSLLAPILRPLLKGGVGIAVVVLSLLWWLSLPYNGMPAQSVAFFCMGAFFSVNGRDPLTIISGKGTWPLLAAWALLVVADWCSHFCFEFADNLYVHRLVLIANIFALLLLGRHVANRWQWPELCVASSFWVYTTHYPLTILLRTLRPSVMDDVSMFAFYLVSSLLVVLFCMAMYALARRTVPRLLALSMGNR